MTGDLLGLSSSVTGVGLGVVLSFVGESLLSGPGSDVGDLVNTSSPTGLLVGDSSTVGCNDGSSFIVGVFDDTPSPIGLFVEGDFVGSV